MNPSRVSRPVIAIIVIIAVSCIVLSQGRGGGPSGPGPSAQRGQGQGGQGQGRGGGRGRGAGPAQGQRRGQEKKQDIEPDDGLVTMYVTVTGREHRAVPGLTRANFQVLEDNVEQRIDAFSVESGPISVGFVVGGDPSEFRGIAPSFLSATPWDDEYFVIVDDGHPPGGTVIQSFTTDIQKVPKNFTIGGVTPDSIYVGLDYLKEAANRRKVLLLFGGSLNTDGAPRAGLDPNYVVRMATRQRVQVYSILTANNGGTTFDDGGTSDIAPLTGGRSYTTGAAAGTLESIADEIAGGIGVQYLIGYRSTNESKDGKWRGIKVRLEDAREDSGKLGVWTRSGYYADKDKKSRN